MTLEYDPTIATNPPAFLREFPTADRLPPHTLGQPNSGPAAIPVHALVRREAAGPVFSSEAQK